MVTLVTLVVRMVDHAVEDLPHRPGSSTTAQHDDTAISTVDDCDRGGVATYDGIQINLFSYYDLPEGSKHFLFANWVPIVFPVRHRSAIAFFSLTPATLTPATLTPAT